jgi:hypothetical protein
MDLTQVPLFGNIGPRQAIGFLSDVFYLLWYTVCITVFRAANLKDIILLLYKINEVNFHKTNKFSITIK